jgi:hypothetical protein
MTRMISFMVMALTMWGCASTPVRPVAASSPIPPPGAVVSARELGLALRLPHDRWSEGESDGSAVVTVTHVRGAHMRVTSRPIDSAGFVATIDAVRREAVAAGCAVRRSARYVTDQFGRRATVSARRATDGGVEDGEITLLQLDGRDGGLIIEAWWPETPSTWTIEDVHDIVDSIRPLPGR